MINLHSTVVLLKVEEIKEYQLQRKDLHSTVVLLKETGQRAFVKGNARFTFYCSSIKRAQEQYQM